MASNMPVRTTSTFTTSGDDTSDSTSQPPYQASSAGGSSEWGRTSTARTSYGDESIEEGGFGDTGVHAGDEPESRQRKPYTARQIQGAEEEVEITCLPEKQGTLLFQYRNYEVATARRNSKVVRRYSDFVWLLDCLHKRFPFRQLPLLPPKRVASKLQSPSVDPDSQYA